MTVSSVLCMLLIAVVAPATPHATPAAHPAAVKPHSADAPADEYFGPLKMSAIGIRMRIDVLGRRYTARSESDADLLHDASDAAAAMTAWNAKYPHDVWAAPTAFHLAQLYAAVQTDDARAQARNAFARVAATYPATSFGHLARLRLAAGFTPLHDESPVIAAAASTAAPSTAAATVSDAASTAAPLPGASVSPSEPASATP